jgi:hypothetical protein
MKLDTVWMICRTEPKPGVLHYAPGRSATEAGSNVLCDERFSFGMSRQSMRREGWRAMKVTINLEKTK